MKHRLTFFLLVGLSGLVVAQDLAPDTEVVSDFPPRRFDAARYASIWDKNPFVTEVALTAKDAPVEDTWANGIIVRAVNRIDGKYVVHLENTTLAKEKDPAKKRLQFQRLTEDAHDADGLQIVSVKAHRDPSQVEVMIASGTDTDAKTATIKYDAKATLPVKLPANPRTPTTTRRLVVPNPPNAAGATPAQQPTLEQRRAAARSRAAARGQGGRGGGNNGQTQGGLGRGRAGRGGGGDSTSTDTPQRRVVLPPGVSR